MRLLQSSLSAAGIISLLATSCATSYTDESATYGPKDRQVVDAETMQPVPGSIVVLTWDKTVTSVESTYATCEHIVNVSTDAQGRYQVPLWHGRYPLISFVYKSGFSGVTDWPSKIKGFDKLKPFVGTSWQRFQELDRMTSGIGGCEGKAVEVKALRLAMNEEAQRIAVNEEERRIASTFQFWADESVYGTEEARRRQIQRESTIRKKQ